MPTFLVVDTETTGFPNPNISFSSAAQARVCQLAAVLYDDRWNELETFCELINPEGAWTIQEGAALCHGITLESCISKGVKQEQAIRVLHNLVTKADYVIAFNFDFDDQMIYIEMENIRDEKLKESFHSSWKNIKYHCAMEASTEVLRLPFKNPKKNFGRKYKWPKLSEAFNYFYPNESFTGAHNSLNDVRATAKVFAKLLEFNHVVLEDLQPAI